MITSQRLSREGPNMASLLTTQLSPRHIWSSLKKALPARTPEHDLEDIGHSTTTIVVVNHKWSIANFSTLGREPIRSPYFGSSTDSPNQFRLVVYPQGDNQNNTDYLSLYLEMQPNNVDELSVFIKFSIIENNRSTYVGGNASLYTFHRGIGSWGYNQFIKRKELLDPLKCWMVDDELKINCEVLLVPPYSTMTTKELLPVLIDTPADSFGNFFGDDCLSDVTFNVAGTEMAASKYILATQSRVFKNLFEQDSTLERITLEDVEDAAFYQFLQYMYTRQISSLEGFAKKLLPLANKYEIASLKDHCEQYLCSQLSKESVLEEINFATEHNALKLKAKAIAFIRRQTTEAVLANPELLPQIFGELALPQYTGGANWLSKTLQHKRSSFTFAHLWRIENFSYLCKNTIKKRIPIIYSCNFSAPEDSSLQFHLELHPRGVNLISRNYVSLYLNMATSKNAKETVQFTFSILDSNDRKRFTKGNELFFSTKVFRRGCLGYGCNFFIKQSALLKKSNNLLPNGTLSILCEVKVLQKNGQDDDKLDDSSADHLKKKSTKVRRPWVAIEKLSDVVLVVGDEEIRAHKILIARRSPVFAAMFKCTCKESTENRVHIAEEQTEVFLEMLAYMYTGKVASLHQVAQPLLQMADKYQVDSLKTLCEKYLFSTISPRTALATLELAKLHNAALLKEKVLKYIKKPAIDAIKAVRDTDLLVQTFRDLVLKVEDLH